MKMKKVIFILLLMVAFCANAQSRIGASKLQIQLEFSDYKQVLSTADDGTPMLTIETSLALYAYYFIGNTCARTVVAPLTDAATQYFVEKYNNGCVIISSSKWKYYSGGMTYVINMEYVNNCYLFVFDIDK